MGGTACTDSKQQPGGSSATACGREEPPQGARTMRKTWLAAVRLMPTLPERVESRKTVVGGSPWNWLMACLVGGVYEGGAQTSGDAGRAHSCCRQASAGKQSAQQQPAALRAPSSSSQGTLARCLRGIEPER